MISWALGIHEVTPEFREEGQSSIKKAQTRRKYRNARNKEVLGRYTHATMKWRAKRLSNTNATHNLRQSTTHADTNDRMRFRARAHKRVARCLAAGRSSRMGEPAMMEGGREGKARPQPTLVRQRTSLLRVTLDWAYPRLAGRSDILSCLGRAGGRWRK